VITDSIEIGDNNIKACPHLGDKGDPCTYLSFATRRNYCYHSKPIAVPGLDHQRSFCLKEDHIECPVFLTEKVSEFPTELNYQGSRQDKKRSRLWVFAIIMVFFIGAISFFFIPGLNFSLISSFQPKTSTPFSASAIETNTPHSIVEPIATQVSRPTISPVPSITPVLVTETPSSVPHKLDEPIGVTHRFVIHRIQAGESLGNLAIQFNTTLAAIQHVNFILPDPVWVDWLVILPLETSNVEGLPSFEAYMLVNGGLTIEEYASKQDLDPSLLKFYNGLPDGYILSNGEWLLIPHVTE